jgi:hypothetical protein
MNLINAMTAVLAVLVLTASAAQANDYLHHGDSKAPGLNSYAMVHRVAFASPSSSVWDSTGQPSGPLCSTLEGYPDCH